MKICFACVLYFITPKRKNEFIFDPILFPQQWWDKPDSNKKLDYYINPLFLNPKKEKKKRLLLQLNVFAHCVISDWHHPSLLASCVWFCLCRTSANVGHERLPTCLVHIDPTDVIRDSDTVLLSIPTFLCRTQADKHVSTSCPWPIRGTICDLKKQWSWKHMELKMTVELHQCYI